MKKTPLHQWHQENGANLAEFGSYSMPLWYPGGAKQEHLQVISEAGLFDTSHMAAVIIEGEDSRKLLQDTLSKDIEQCVGKNRTPLADNRCVYGLFLNNSGFVIDDAIVYQVAEDKYMVVVNAGMGEKICEHLSALTTNNNVQLTDMTDKLGKIDIQGPASAQILSKILQNPSEVLNGLPYFSFKGWFEPTTETEVLLEDGTPILLSRTGYTGEFGFELFLDPEKLVFVWEQLILAGGMKILPCGLAARDSLRAGAVLPLSHQDIGDWTFGNNPWMFAVAVEEDGSFSKDFIGRSAMEDSDVSSFTYPFAGYDLRKITVSESSAVLDAEGNRIGEILTCATDMAIGRVEDRIISTGTPESDGRPENFKPKGLCCGFVKLLSRVEYGTEVYLTDGKRKLKVEIRKDIRPDRTARKPLKEMI